MQDSKGYISWVCVCVRVTSHLLSGHEGVKKFDFLHLTPSEALEGTQQHSTLSKTMPMLAHREKN